MEEVVPTKLDKDDRIEKWISQDVSVLDPSGSSLLVIGEQVRTDFQQRIDLLCMDSDGNLVVVELKRDKTPREVTSQALEYASWVESLDSKQVEDSASRFLKGKTLKEAFEEIAGRGRASCANFTVAPEEAEQNVRSGKTKRTVRRKLCPFGLKRPQMNPFASS